MGFDSTQAEAEQKVEAQEEPPHTLVDWLCDTLGYEVPEDLEPTPDGSLKKVGVGF